MPLLTLIQPCDHQLISAVWFSCIKPTSFSVTGDNKLTTLAKLGISILLYTLRALKN